MSDHTTAFSRLTYECISCRKVDFIWNNREEAAPDGVLCKSRQTAKGCNSLMKRINSERDIKFKVLPQLTDRVFVNIDMGKARDLAKEEYKAKKDLGLPCSIHPRISVSEVVENRAMEIYDDGKRPDTIARYEYETQLLKGMY